MPDDDTLRELGRMQILHSQLDNMLRLVIKRALGISIDDPGYWNETRGMTRDLRERARRLIDERYEDDDNTAGLLNKALDDAEEATTFRNRIFHSVWIQDSGGQPVLQDRDKQSKEHKTYTLPTAEDIRSVSERIERIYRVLNVVTKRLL